MQKLIYTNLEGQPFFNEQKGQLEECFDPAQVTILFDAMDNGLPVQAIAYADIPTESMCVFVEHMKNDIKWRKKWITLFLRRFDLLEQFLPTFNLEQQLFYWKIGRLYKDPVVIDSILRYGKYFFKDLKKKYKRPNISDIEVLQFIYDQMSDTGYSENGYNDFLNTSLSENKYKDALKQYLDKKIQEEKKSP